MQEIASLLATVAASAVLEMSNAILAKRRKIVPDFEERLKALHKERSVDAVVLFRDRLEPQTRKSIDEGGFQARSELVKTLSEESRKTRNDTLDFLDKEGKDLLRKDLRREAIRQFPLLNGLVTPVNSKLANALAARDDVIAVLENCETQLVQPTETDVRDIVKREMKYEITWGLKRLRVPDLWAEGLTGHQTRVGHLDTGVFEDHIELQEKVASWMAFSPQGRELSGCPSYDTGYHGTHTAGTIVGAEASGIKIGAAPGAKLVSGLVLQGSGGTLTQLMAGIEWAASEDIHVLNLSLGFGTYLEAFEKIASKLLAAGIFPAFAIGNESHGNTSSPGNSSACCAVGAMDYDGKVTDFSSGATLTHFDEESGKLTHTIKPDVVAPGHAVLSCVPPLTGGVTIGGYHYNYLNGTSMATPLVAGVVALLIEAVGDRKSAADIMRALYETTRRRPRGEKDNRWGFGLLDPVAALRVLRR